MKYYIARTEYQVEPSITISDKSIRDWNGFHVTTEQDHISKAVEYIHKLYPSTTNLPVCVNIR